MAICARLALGVISLFDSYPWTLNAGRLLTVTVLGLMQRTTELDGTRRVIRGAVCR